MKLTGALLAIGPLAMMFPSDGLAQYRVIVEPTIEVSQVHDDNLFFSALQPARDMIVRAKPSLALRVESPRGFAAGEYGFDSERFANHPAMTKARARQHATVNVDYRPDQRLELAMGGTYTDTDIPSDLNIETGLIASRLRVQQLSFGPSARFRISPTQNAHASLTSTVQTPAGGGGMRSQFQTVGLEQRLTPRDLFSVDFEHGSYMFDLRGMSTRTNTFLARSAWTHQLSARTSMTFQAGPRLTGHALSPELSGSVTHGWQYSSVTISGGQTETTAIGASAPVTARSLQARFTLIPSQSLSAYVTPAIVRSMSQSLEAKVYRIGVGARYAFTPLTCFDVTYSLDSQHGSIGAFQPAGGISRSVLSVALTTGWIAPDKAGTARR